MRAPLLDAATPLSAPTSSAEATGAATSSQGARSTDSADAAQPSSEAVPRPPHRRPPRARWALGVAVCTNLFCNHWARDSIGALELPLESSADAYALSVRQYETLSGAYFFPSVLLPVLAGMLAQRYGAANTLVGFAAISFVGNALVALSAWWGSFPLLLSGRVLMGMSYEALDMLPIGFMAPRFGDCWGTLVGLINGANRLGSVLNFLLEAPIYQTFGLGAALIVPSVLGKTLTHDPPPPPHPSLPTPRSPTHPPHPPLPTPDPYPRSLPPLPTTTS